MHITSYIVTCQKCKGKDTLKISSPDNTVFYTNHVPIISARFRPDGNWGFECQCGNDSRVAPEEKDQVEVLVRGGEHAIDAIRKTLSAKNETKFNMAVA